MTGTALTARILAPALLEGDDLVAAGMLEHLAGHHGAGDGGGADLRAIAAEQQHFAELDHLARLGRDAVDPDHILSHDAVLLTAGFDDCEHRFFLVFVTGLGPFRIGFFQSICLVFLRT